MPAIVTLTMNPALDVATATDTIVPSTKLRCEEPRYDPGGGGINVARAVHMLGGDALAVYPAGGATGEMIRGVSRKGRRTAGGRAGRLDDAAEPGGRRAAEREAVSLPAAGAAPGRA